MTKTALAKVVGVNMTSISRWEDVENPSPPTLDKAVQVAEALGVSLEELVYGRESTFERALSQARQEFAAQTAAQIALLREELRQERGVQLPQRAGRQR